MRQVWRRFGVAAVVVLLALVALVTTGAPSAASVPPEPAPWHSAATSPSTPASPSTRPSSIDAGSPSPFAVTSPVPEGPPVVPGAESAARRWSWPLRPRPPVLARFDPPDVAWGAGHRGVDLAASVGQEVLSPADGVVTFSAVVVDRGVVVVTMPSGLRATFEPVEDGPPVGTAVAAGQPVGRVAATPGHCAPATCLHWGVLRDDTYLDPLALVGATRVILLPLLPRPPP